MNLLELTNLLNTSPLFQALSETELQKLIARGVLKSFAARSVVAYAGEPLDKFFIITSGKLAALKVSAEGRNLWISEFSSGEIFWGLAFFEHGISMPVTLESTIPSQVMFWDQETIRPLMETNGKFSWEMLRLMAKTMARASAIVEGLAFQPVAGRIASYLLEKYPTDDVNFSRDFTLEEIAARAGTTREVVCRSLQRFASDGLIEITRTELRIRDRNKLESNFDPNKTNSQL